MYTEVLTCSCFSCEDVKARCFGTKDFNGEIDRWMDEFALQSGQQAAMGEGYLYTIRGTRSEMGTERLRPTDRPTDFRQHAD